MYCHTHHCHGCHHCFPVMPGPALFWCTPCGRYTSHFHTHWTPPPVVRPYITCGPQQRDAATIRALAG